MPDLGVVGELAGDQLVEPRRPGSADLSSRDPGKRIRLALCVPDDADAVPEEEESLEPGVAKGLGELRPELTMSSLVLGLRAGIELEAEADAFQR